MPRIDPTMASLFRMDWLVPLDATTEDDYTRGVAEKADILLHSARFMSEQHATAGADMEVRVWIEAACGPACVSVTWEPGMQRFGFHLLDETLRERLGCIVFDKLPCIDAEGSLAQADMILDAALRAISESEDGLDLGEVADRVRAATADSVRVPVKDARERADS